METESECVATGLLLRNGREVAVTMQWHMSHSLSKEFSKEFLKLRCKALQGVFGNLNHARGISSVVIGPDGVRLDFDKKVVNHPKPCIVVMGFMWPDIDDARWEIVKEGFKEVFIPAAIHGNSKCDENTNFVHISSQFELAEKGGD